MGRNHIQLHGKSILGTEDNNQHGILHKYL